MGEPRARPRFNITGPKESATGAEGQTVEGKTQGRICSQGLRLCAEAAPADERIEALGQCFGYADAGRPE